MTTVTGGCLCGAVTYEVELPFRRANWCHCSRCRRQSGGHGLAQGRVARERFRLLGGEDRIGNHRPEGAMAKAFCRDCGTSLFGGRWPDGDEVSVRLGTLDDDPRIRPSYRSFCAGEVGWLPIPDDGLPRFEGRPTAEAERG